MKTELSKSVQNYGVTLPTQLSPTGRNLVLVGAFLGWMLAGVQLAMTSLAMGPAATDLLIVEVPENGLLVPQDDQLVAQWFGWLTAAFLTGTAMGGLLFGWIGDLTGRSKALALAILCYSLMSALAYFSQDHWQFLVLRFLAGLGVGGTWPNGVSLVSEAWKNLTRPLVAGLMGAAANVGIILMAQTASIYPITHESWRWVMLVGSASFFLSIFVAFVVPESPSWLATRRIKQKKEQTSVSVSQIFRRPLLSTTLVGIGLATVPLIGAWGSANWMLRWADQVVEIQQENQETGGLNKTESVDPTLKARLSRARSLTGTLGALLGGWIATLLGRHRAYFLNSLFALVVAQYCFWFLIPSDVAFLYWFAALGFFSGVYFGWLPLFLPELFTTRIRATGSGVSFNFGRILTVVTLLTTATLVSMLGSSYASIGKITSLIYALGLLLIYFCPVTEKRLIED